LPKKGKFQNLPGTFNTSFGKTLRAFKGNIESCLHYALIKINTTADKKGRNLGFFDHDSLNRAKRILKQHFMEFF